jgi:hypothetical protein
MSLTLAAGSGLGVIIFFAFIVINILIKAMNNKNKKQPTQSPTSPAAPAGQSRAQRLEQLAAKRRAELQQLASQHQHPTATPPANLTQQQASDRQHAKTLYERRAEALRQMQQQQRSAPPSQPQPRHEAPQHQQRQAPPRRPVTQQQPRPEPPRQTSQQHDLSQVRERELQLLKQREANLMRREEMLKRKADQLGSGVKQVSHEEHGDLEIIHRHVDDVQTVVTKPRNASKLLGEMKLDRNTLRKAFILKEILDPPVALRQTQEQ